MSTCTVRGLSALGIAVSDVVAACAYLFCVSVACSYVFCALSSANRESFARFSASVGSNVEMGGVTPHWFSAAMMASRCSWRMRSLGDREIGCRARLLMSRPGVCWSQKFNLLGL